MFAIYNFDQRKWIAQGGEKTVDEPRVFRLRGHAKMARKINLFCEDEPGWKVVPVIIEPVEEA